MKKVFENCPNLVFVAPLTEVVNGAKDQNNYGLDFPPPGVMQHALFLTSNHFCE